MGDVRAEAQAAELVWQAAQRTIPAHDWRIYRGQLTTDQQPTSTGDSK